VYVLRSVPDEGPASMPGEPTCAACGGRLVRLGFVPAASAMAFDTSEADERSEPLPEAMCGSAS
jgi:hypothetical protein